MNVTFYISASIAVLATVLAITRKKAVHGLLYTVVSFLSVAVTFLILGAPFAAALEVITYAGAIMIMVLFVIMTLTPEVKNTGIKDPESFKRPWIVPILLVLVLLGEFVYIVVAGSGPDLSGTQISPKQVGIALFAEYALGTELATMLLLAGLAGAYHLWHSSHEDGRL